MPFEIIDLGGKPIKAWLPADHLIEETARQQLGRVSRMPFVTEVICMPDVHAGCGATIGSVIATEGAIIPAAVGVDIGCGMDYQRLSITEADLPQDLKVVREAIERAVPHGRTNHGQAGDRGAWAEPPASVCRVWRKHFSERFSRLVRLHPRLQHPYALEHLGTLGTGNHFIELTVDEQGRVGIMLHSGSRGVGNRFGTYFIRLAKQHVKQLAKEKGRWHAGVKSGHLPANTPAPTYYPVQDRDLSYLFEGTAEFGDYMEAVGWAQDYARANRNLMMLHILQALNSLSKEGKFPTFVLGELEVSCHHNYVAREQHHGRDLWVTRKGAVRAQPGDIGLIPGSMGARSFIVEGQGNPESLNSCAHGAGRTMSRTAARQTIKLEQHQADLAGIECRVDEAGIDESPSAYKDIGKVMEVQVEHGLVTVLHELRQVICVKG